MSSLERIPMTASEMPPSLKQTTCPYCGVGCGVDVQLDAAAGGASPVAVSGTPEHPANYGRLCVKGSHLLDTLEKGGRLLAPTIDDVAVSWDKATDEVAHRFSSIIQEHGPDAVAFYVSGQLLTEDYYVANKLMKGYIGSANIDTNSRLCMSSAVAAHKKAFGSDAVPCSYEDLEQTDLLVFIGSNAAWTHPVLFQRIERAKQRNSKLQLVFIDPRKTASCASADLHLPIKAGTDVILFNGLLTYLAQNGGINEAYVNASVEGLDAALAAASPWTLEAVAKSCDIDIKDVLRFYELFCATEKVLSFFSMGVNQSSAGVDKASSIINCHLASGKIGKAGSGPFSITGQPNAMGGREVGGLANLLAAHMDIDNASHRQIVQDYWSSPTIVDQPGLKAVDLFKRIGSGEVKAVWIIATNPLVSMPNRKDVETALEKCELVVVSDYVSSNDTMAYADIKLPATSWSEKDGTVTNSERRISRQRAFLPPLGEARHDWKTICDVAQKMGFSGFEFNNPHEIFLEYAGLTAYKNDGTRDLDLSGLSQLTLEEYEELSPIQWPVNANNPQGTRRLFVDGKYYTRTGKAQCSALEYRAPLQSVSSDYPFVLNSGRLRDQWHTMTRTGVSAELSQHAEEAFLFMHPRDAAALGFGEGSYVRVQSAVSGSEQSQVILPLKFDEGLRQGELFAPIHWGKQWASSSSVAHLFSDARDPVSGQPELKHAAVSLSACDIQQYAYLVVRNELSLQFLNAHADVWSKSTIRGAYAYRIANFEWKAALDSALKQADTENCELMGHSSARMTRALALYDGAVDTVLFADQDRVPFPRAWLEALFAENTMSGEQIRSVLSGQADEEFEQGRVVCSCFNVRENSILRAIEEQGCNSVETLGKTLSCGTNCGSCKSELKQMLAETVAPAAILTLEEGVA
jgi:assimilatory nitrate reductase catalytic subunit